MSGRPGVGVASLTDCNKFKDAQEEDNAEVKHVTLWKPYLKVKRFPYLTNCSFKVALIHHFMYEDEDLSLAYDMRTRSLFCTQR